MKALPAIAAILCQLPSVSLAAEQLFVASPLTQEGQFTGGIEGPCVDSVGNVYAVNFEKEGTVGRTSPSGEAALFVTLPTGSTGNGMRIGALGEAYIADYTGHNILRLNLATQEVTVFAHNAEMNQPNDIAITRDGILYASDPNWKDSTGQIWRIDAAGKFTRVAEGMGTANGIEVSPDGAHLYVNESAQRKVWSFDIDTKGALQNKRLIKEFPDHGFDGMRCDIDGNLYITRHGKGTVVKMTPQGEVLQEIDVLGASPSNLCFGGPDGRTIYVTEMEKRRLVQFRVDQPGREFSLWKSAPQTGEVEPKNLQRFVAVKNVCAWPNLTLMPDGSITAVLFNQPGHGTMQGDVDCYASKDGTEWEKRATVTQHEPNTIRMNHSAGLAKNGDLVVLCSGWTNEQQPDRPKQADFRDDILAPWVMRSSDGGRSWTKETAFPLAESAEWSQHIPFGDIWTGTDGALHTSTYQGQFADPKKGTKTKSWRSWSLRSDDDGHTWQTVSVIGPQHNETDILPQSDGSWLAAARTDSMEIFRSTDDGKTWSSLGKPTARNEINGQLCQLKDGRLLLSYGVRIAGRHGVCAKFSDDGGKTWSEPLRIAHSFVGDCGYPSSVQRADGKIVTAYYSKTAPELNAYHMGVAIWSAP